MSSERPDYLYEAPRVALRRVTRHDQDEFIRLATCSITLHKRWIVAPTTPEEFAAYLDRYGQDTAEGLLVCLRETDTIAGFINIDHIMRHPYHRATLGYGAFAPTTHLGYMYESFPLLFRLAFGDLKLHRLEADIQPSNIASLNLVKKLGFRYEGCSPDFILINNKWADHERWAITSDMVDM